eukprot:4976079-Pyramimonas_sp.AAC.1
MRPWTQAHERRSVTGLQRSIYGILQARGERDPERRMRSQLGSCAVPLVSPVACATCRCDAPAAH